MAIIRPLGKPALANNYSTLVNKPFWSKEERDLIDHKLKNLGSLEVKNTFISEVQEEINGGLYPLALGKISRALKVNSEDPDLPRLRGVAYLKAAESMRKEELLDFQNSSTQEIDLSNQIHCALLLKRALRDLPSGEKETFDGKTFKEEEINKIIKEAFAALIEDLITNGLSGKYRYSGSAIVSEIVYKTYLKAASLSVYSLDWIHDGIAINGFEYACNPSLGFEERARVQKLAAKHSKIARSLR